MAYIVVPAFVAGNVATAAQLEALRTNQLLDPTALATAKGSLFVATAANAIAELTVGANGLFPVADSTQTTGILWTTLATRNVLSPAQITGNQNDYNPTGLSTASMLRLSTDASRNITSIATGSAGRILFIHNVGSFNLVLKDDDAATGTAANRLALTADITLTPDSVVILQYDATTSRWRAIAGGGGGGSGIAATEFDAKGDLLVGSANDAFDNLGVGANGTVLEADSTQTLGVKWGSKSGGSSAFRFHDDDLTASGTSVAMNIPGDTGLVEITMPYAGSIVAVSVACQNARTAGTATFKPTINGTESSTLSAVLNGTNTQYHSGTQAAGVDSFTANQRIGVKVTTDGSWAAGATPSVDVEVFIVPTGMSGGISTASAQLGADVTLTNANQFYDGPSVSLAAGTWYVIASVQLFRAAGGTTNEQFTAKLWDGTTVESSSQCTIRDSGSQVGSITLAGIVSPGSTTTYKISVTSSNNGPKIVAAAVTNGQGNNASWIRAFKIG